MTSKYINRRVFLKQSLAMAGMAAAALSDERKTSNKFSANLSHLPQPGQSRVVVSRSDSVRTGAGKITSDGVKKLLDRAMEHLFQVSSAEIAWKKLIQPEDMVGLKPNCLAGKGMSTHTELVEAVIESLLRAGVRKNHIIIWERLSDDLERSGYKIYYGKNEVQCYGNDFAGYSEDLYVYGKIASLLSRVVTGPCNVLINLPVLKDHGIVGFSGGLKNYFGAIHNPNKYHNNVGDPYVAEVNCLPAIKNKSKITICDALTAQFEGGPPFMPQWSWPVNGLLVALDTVALDRVGWQMIEDKRQEQGMPSLVKVGREPKYIYTAGDEWHRLGTCDWKKIDLVHC